MHTIEYYSWRNVVGARQPMDQQRMSYGFKGIQGSVYHEVEMFGGRNFTNKQIQNQSNQAGADWLERMLIDRWCAVQIPTDPIHWGHYRQLRTLEDLLRNICVSDFALINWHWWQMRFQRVLDIDLEHQYLHTVWAWVPKKSDAVLLKLAL